MNVYEIFSLFRFFYSKEENKKIVGHMKISVLLLNFLSDMAYFALKSQILNLEEQEYLKMTGDLNKIIN